MKKTWFLKNFRYVFACVEKFFKIMRISFFLIALASLQTFAITNYAQSKKIDLKIEKTSITKVLEKIERETEFFFFYNNQVVNLDRQISIDLKEKTINEVLDAIFRESNINYTINNRQIILSVAGNSNATFQQQQKPISGKVTDSSGGSLPGVSVVVKGTTTGSITDVNGSFSLTNIAPDATLQFSFVGMKMQEVVVGSKTIINVTLEVESFGLDEVVAIGYGTQKKGTMTSSVSVVKADEIQKSAVADVSNTLSGKAAGLIVRNNNAEPGSDASTIYVRGVSTTGDNSALVVVDGIPGRDLSLVDINDIESVTVLKDASAVAPYGSRGANGVILITTKRGKNGNPTINYTTYYGVEKPTRLPQFCSSADYARMFNEASRNEGKEEPFSADDISKYEAGTNPDYPNTNWWNEIIQNDPVQAQHHLSLSGANEKVSYYLSLGAFRQDAYFDRANFKKYNVRANIDANVTKEIKVSFDMSGYTNKKQSPNNGGWDAMYNLLENPMRSPNTWPVKNADGHYVKPSMTNNPVADLALGGNTVNKSNNFNGSLSFEYKPSFLKGITLKALGVYDFGVSHKKIWQT
ncbi:MAG: SusC/RagA family TonB-linked outer membrane protein, partial [Peptostreptococcaceae bacterium]|nr:SusC/RagA family TonB-linked outer membrane protein [Peptostreptococcaceae bacterium]